ncbi:MAG: hypothetical protein ACHQ6U_13660 [Thermodesulfobacteriota bacterium]
MEDWNEAEIPKIPGIEAQIKELDSMIESLKAELKNYVSVEVRGIPEPVCDDSMKRYKLPE